MRRGFIVLIALCMTGMSLMAQDDLEARVHRAADRMLATFPVLNLQDVYKSCFQERFGTRHLVGDDRRQAMVDYINRECAYMVEQGRPDLGNTPMYEYTGIDSLYVRVNLSLVLDSTITAEELAECFMAGAKPVGEEEIARWKDDWTLILHYLQPYSHKLGNYEADSAVLAANLAQGKYAYHHSARFNEAYSYHYRLIRKDLFENRILPRMKNR